MPLLLLVVLVVLSLAAWEVCAQGSDRGPFDPALWLTYAWVIGVSMLGGLASFLRNVKARKARPFNLVELFGEMITSGLAGLLTFWIGHAAGLNLWALCALAGIAGHMGSRAMFMLERLLESWGAGLAKRFGVSMDVDEHEPQRK